MFAAPFQIINQNVIPVALLAKWEGFDSLTVIINGFSPEYISSVILDTKRGARVCVCVCAR